MACRAHLVQSGHTIQKPDVVQHVVLVDVDDVRIRAIAIKSTSAVRVARVKPGLLRSR
jgi:hypothetical protein